MTESVTIDHFDQKLLALVQKNNLQPARELAELSVSPKALFFGACGVCAAKG